MRIVMVEARPVWGVLFFLGALCFVVVLTGVVLAGDRGTAIQPDITAARKRLTSGCRPVATSGSLVRLCKSRQASRLRLRARLSASVRAGKRAACGYGPAPRAELCCRRNTRAT